MNLVPQLAESIPKSKLVDYLTNDRYYAEQKIDGVRKLVTVTDNQVFVVGREGQPTDLPTVEPFRLTGTWAFDGELLHDGTFWVFDLVASPVVQVDGKPMQVGVTTKLADRRSVLDDLTPVLESRGVRVLPCARTTVEKLTLAKRVLETHGEGVMLKDVKAGYASGKRSLGALKCKYVKDVDAFITRFGVGLRSDGSGKPKQNCELAVYNDAGKEQVIGECIIHPKERNQVDVRSVVTVNYLYAVNTDTPRLVQPTRIRPRFDKKPEECTLDQIQFTNREVVV